MHRVYIRFWPTLHMNQAAHEHAPLTSTTALRQWYVSFSNLQPPSMQDRKRIKQRNQQVCTPHLDHCSATVLNFSFMLSMRSPASVPSEEDAAPSTTLEAHSDGMRGKHLHMCVCVFVCVCVRVCMCVCVCVCVCACV